MKDKCRLPFREMSVAFSRIERYRRSPRKSAACGSRPNTKFRDRVSDIWSWRMFSPKRRLSQATWRVGQADGSCAVCAPFCLQFRCQRPCGLKGQRQLNIIAVNGRLKLRERFCVLVIGEMRCAEIHFSLVIMADERHKHCRMNVELSHAADEGVAKRVENFAVVSDFSFVQIGGESPRHVFSLSVGPRFEIWEELDCSTLAQSVDIREEAGFDYSAVKRNASLRV